MPLRTRHSFQVRYKAPNGQTYYGTFTVRLPSAEDYRSIAVALSNLLRGARWDSLSPDLQIVMMAMARCSVLVEEAPDWFHQPLDQIGPELFISVSQEAERFERAFFRQLTTAGENGETGLVVEIRPLEGPADLGAATFGPPRS